MKNLPPSSQTQPTEPEKGHPDNQQKFLNLLLQQTFFDVAANFY